MYPEIYENTQVREENTLSQFPQLEIQGEIIELFGTELVIDKPLCIPQGYTFVLKPGQKISFLQDGFLLCRSAVSWEGTQEQPILFTSPDDSLYSGLIIMEAEEKSTLQHVIFDNLGELRSGAWILTGAVTFYESDVHIQQCQFLNNRSEDGLNAVRSDIYVKDTLFENTYQDAFDSDFSTGVFENVVFRDAGNDAFDVSTSTFHLINCQFYNTWDKAISTGEASHVTGENLVIQGAQSGLAAKDSSTLVVDNVTVSDVFIGICVYQKKPEFGPSTLTATNYKLTGRYDFPYIIQTQDQVFVNGEQLETSDNENLQIIIDYMIEEVEIS